MSLPEESKQNERSRSFYLLASADTGAQNTTKNCAIYHDVQKSYHKKKAGVKTNGVSKGTRTDVNLEYSVPDNNSTDEFPKRKSWHE